MENINNIKAGKLHLMHRKKSNIDIVKDYLSGTRPFIQVGYTAKEVKHKDGEEWTDISGKRWKMVDGGKISVNSQADMIRDMTRQKCGCGQDIRYGTRLDEKFFLKTGKCFDCVIKEETELRVLGVFPQYEHYKLMSNYLGFLEDMKQKIEDSVKYFASESDTLSVLCNSEGFIEKFKGMNTSDLLETAKKDLKEITELISKVIIEKAKVKKLYETSLAKAKKRLMPKKK